MILPFFIFFFFLFAWNIMVYDIVSKRRCENVRHFEMEISCFEICCLYLECVFGRCIVREIMLVQ